MNGYQSIPVSPFLQPYVRAAWMQHDAATHMPLQAVTVFPTPYPVVGCQYRGGMRVVRHGVTEALGRSGITGLQERFRQFVGDAETRSVLVVLEPHAGWALLGHAMDEIAGEHPPLDALFSVRLVRNFEERLASASSARERIVALEEFLTDLVRRSRHEPHPGVVPAVRQILASGGRTPVEAIAAGVSIGRRQLERLFLREVGVSPKEFSSIVQFDRAMRSIADHPSSAALALHAGYADQAHLVRSFSRRAGVPPGRFRRSGHSG